MISKMSTHEQTEIVDKLRDEADFLERNLLTGCLNRYVYGPSAKTMRKAANIIEKLLNEMK